MMLKKWSLLGLFCMLAAVCSWYVLEQRSSDPSENAGRLIKNGDETGQASLPKVEAMMGSTSSLSWGLPEKNARLLANSPILPLTASELSPNLREAIQKADKDPLFAYRLWLFDDRCRNLLATLLARQRNSSASDPLVGAGIESKCSGLAAEFDAHRSRLLSLAADAGIAQAQIDYVNKGIFNPSDPQDGRGLQLLDERTKSLAMSRLHAAADTGAVEALITLAGVYETGVLVNRDLVASYAYDYAAHLSGLVKGGEAVLAVKARQMTHEQKARGESLGSTIYQQCCTNVR